MNNSHNPNQHAQQPEVVMSLNEYRLRKLQEALMIAERSATNEINQPAEIMVTEVQATPQAFSNQDATSKSRQLVEEAFAPQVTEAVQVVQQPAQVLPMQPRANEPNTLPIDELRRAA